jgi:hypothetical protein
MVTRNRASARIVLLFALSPFPFFALTPGAYAQTYPLAESPQAGDCAQVHLEMNLSGELHFTKDGRPQTRKQTVVAMHDFAERVLVVGPGGAVQKAARVYETARAVFQVGDKRSERVLRPERALLVVQRPKDQLLTYCPKGPLTREEVELTGEQFDTLALAGLLPGKAVAIKETWNVANETAQALCQFEGITNQDLKCTLQGVEGNVVSVAVSGTATGIDLGALVKVSVEATYRFDLSAKRVVAVEWKQKDDRGQGPASPASVVATTYTVKRTPIERPDTLSDVALIAVPRDFDPPAPMVQLTYHDPKARFDLMYAREWQVVGQTAEHLVLRLLDRGEFVCQATITPWAKAAPGQHQSPEAFQKEMSEMPGWKPEDVLQTGVVSSADTPGRWVYRVSALGEMDGIRVLQNFYLVAGPNGDQVVLAFTMAQTQAEKLGTRDLALVGSIELPEKK